MKVARRENIETKIVNPLNVKKKKLVGGYGPYLYRDAQRQHPWILELTVEPDEKRKGSQGPIQNNII